MGKQNYGKAGGARKWRPKKANDTPDNEPEQAPGRSAWTEPGPCP